MNVAIIGCGLIGQKRAKVVNGARLVVCADSNLLRAEHRARTVKECAATADWRCAIERDDVTMVIVATPHNSLAEITSAAVTAGKHVLVEKPAARHVSELRPLLASIKQNKTLVRVGFNHRYHRAFQHARKIVDSGALGQLMFLRTRYGHGGRIGYEQEWRAKPEISGGGE